MSYQPTNWQNGITPINENNLNKIEQRLARMDSIPTSGIIGYEGEQTDIPDGYEIVDGLVKNVYSNSQEYSYSCNYINNLEKSFMTLYLTANQNISSTDYTQINIDRVIDKRGDGFSLINNQIVCNRAMNVKVNGLLTISTSNAGLKECPIAKNSVANLSYNRFYMYTYSSAPLITRVIPLQQGDSLCLRYKGTSGDIVLGGNSANTTFLSVEEV